MSYVSPEGRWGPSAAACVRGPRILLTERYGTVQVSQATTWIPAPVARTAGGWSEQAAGAVSPEHIRWAVVRFLGGTNIGRDGMS